MYIRINAKNINFGNKKNQKSDFYKNKKAFQIDNIDVNKILVSEKEPYDTKNALNTLSDIMIMLLDHYV